MLAVNYATIRDDWEVYCDRVASEYETLIVTRNEEKSIVVISLDEYNALIKAAKNAEYLAMIDRSMRQLSEGKGRRHDLIEVGDE